MVIPQENLDPGRWYVGFVWKNFRQVGVNSLEWDGNVFLYGSKTLPYRGFGDTSDGFEPAMPDLPPKPPNEMRKAA